MTPALALLRPTILALLAVLLALGAILSPAAYRGTHAPLRPVAFLSALSIALACAVLVGVVAADFGY